VKSDYVDVGGIFLEEVCDCPGDECIAEAVKAIFAQPILLGRVWIDRIRGNMRRDSRMELRIKASNVDSPRKLLHAGLNNAQGCPVVQRRKVTQLF
jgi:hypothetical protein